MKKTILISLLYSLMQCFGLYAMTDKEKEAAFKCSMEDFFVSILTTSLPYDSEGVITPQNLIEGYISYNSLKYEDARKFLHKMVALNTAGFEVLKTKTHHNLSQHHHRQIANSAIGMLGTFGNQSSIPIIEKRVERMIAEGEKVLNPYLRILEIVDFDRDYVLKYLKMDEGRIALSVLQIMFTAYKKAIADGDTERVERLSKLIGELYYIEDHSEDYKEWVHRKFKYNKIPLSNIGVNAAAKESEESQNINSLVSLQEEKQTKPAKVSEKTPVLQNNTVEKDDDNSWLIYLLAILGIAVAVGLLKGRKQK